MDVSKIREKGELAKALVQRGIAADMHEAHEMINSKGMVKTGFNPDDQQQKVMDEIKVDEQVEQIAGGNNGILKRVEQLEQMLQQFRDFFNKYKTSNDSNLKELDSNIRMMMRKLEKGAVSNVQPVSEPAKQEQQQEQQQEQKRPQGDTKPQAPAMNLDPSKFSVENIFNNSHGRMLKNKK
ncbi:hypothetical protein KY340_02790 [Candidatus Woesearchaeota archaeon]|nr:hypothetical protein [Candidatus Woesearchaeota archaeon]